MTWLISLGTGVITAVLGALALGFLADRWTIWFRVSNFEGAAGYYVLFYGLLGAVGGFLVGVACSRHVVQGAESHFVRGLFLALRWIASVMGGLAVLSYFAADHPPVLQGRRLVLDLELRAPPTAPFGTADGTRPMVSLESRPGKTVAYGVPEASQVQRLTEGWRLSFTLPLASSSATRAVRVGGSKEFHLLFLLSLRPKPTKVDFEWSGWQQPTEVDPALPPGAEGGSGYELRYRVGFLPEPPPQRSTAELNQERDAAQAAALRALSPNAPLRDWMPFTRQDIPPVTQAEALLAMRGRSAFVAELSALFVDEDAELAAEALRLVPRLTGLEGGLLEPVTHAGRDLLTRLERATALPAEADPAYREAGTVSHRFSAWMAAVSHLRSHGGGDFTAELRALLAAARKRPDSLALRQDVVRVASFYLKEWAGDAPLATDPPPR